MRWQIINQFFASPNSSLIASFPPCEENQKSRYFFSIICGNLEKLHLIVKHNVSKVTLVIKRASLLVLLPMAALVMAAFADDGSIVITTSQTSYPGYGNGYPDMIADMLVTIAHIPIIRSLLTRCRCIKSITLLTKEAHLQLDLANTVPTAQLLPIW